MRGPRVGRFNVSSFEMPSPVTLSDAKKAAIDVALDCEPGPHFHEALERIATQFVIELESDRARPPTKGTLNRIEMIISRTEDLLAVLPRWEGCAEEGTMPACDDPVEVVSGNMLFELSGQAPEGYRSYDELKSGLAAFRSNLLEVHGFLEVDAELSKESDWSGPFEHLILGLQRLCEGRGIRVTARGDSDKSRGKSSPFVELVWLVQSELPKTARLYDHSKEGLAKAIQKARRRTANLLRY